MNETLSYPDPGLDLSDGFKPHTSHYHPINHLKRIALRGNHRKPLVRIKKTELTHRIHLPESYRDS